MLIANICLPVIFILNKSRYHVLHTFRPGQRIIEETVRHTQATVKKKGKDLFHLHPARKARADRLLHLHIIPSLGLFLRSWPPISVLLLTNLPLLRNPHFFHADLDSNAAFQSINNAVLVGRIQIEHI